MRGVDVDGDFELPRGPMKLVDLRLALDVALKSIIDELSERKPRPVVQMPQDG
jgi:hypothetical protein